MSETDVSEWIRLATHDIETADLLINEKGHADIIIYHLHQAVEKLLKALMIKSKKKFDKVHFLDKLLSEVIGEYPALNEIKDNILELNLYLPKLRYPYGEPISFEEALNIYDKFLQTKNILLSTINLL